MNSQPKESDILRSCLDYLAHSKVGEFWRSNTGRKGGIRYGKKGSGDITGLIKPTGQRVEIEVKTEDGKQTKDQKEFQQKIERFGGRYLLARGVQDLIDANL